MFELAAKEPELLLDAPKVFDEFEPKTGTAVFVPNEHVFVLPKEGLFSIPNP